MLLIRFALFLVCTLQNLIYLFNTKVIDGFLEKSDKFAQNRLIYIQKWQKQKILIFKLIPNNQFQGKY